MATEDEATPRGQTLVSGGSSLAEVATVNWEGLTPPYATLVVDPPWHYDKINPDSQESRGNYKRPIPYVGGGLAYSSMTLDEIRALPVTELVSDGRCFLWLTNRYLRYGWSILEGWGFTPLERTFVWCKPPRGTTPVTTEFFLIGTKGRPPRLPWCGTTWFDWPWKRFAHSVKPDAFGDLVEAWCPGPYVELFAREPRLGWDSWGYGYESASA